MKQVFTKIYQDKFIKYFNIKNNPSKIEEDYYRKTIKYIKYIKWIPGLKMIGVGNSISMNCAKPSSDIDLFIVNSNNSMWLVRILTTLIFQILGVRKTEKKHEGRFCLSFFSTIDGMDFSNFKIENDIYLYFRIIYFKPILNYDNTYELFLEKNSSWADFNEYSSIIEENKKYIKYKSPHPGIPSPKGRGRLHSFCFPFIPSPVGRGLGGGLNSLLKKFFLPKTIKHYNALGKPMGVIINNNMLKFHNNDIREKTKEELA